MNPIELLAFYVALVSPLWAPFLWGEIRDEMRRRKNTEVNARDLADLCERNRLECETAKRRRDGVE